MKIRKTDRIRHACIAFLCATSLCWTGITRAQDKQEQVTVNDVDRTFMVHLPAGYDVLKHYPVVLLLPGRQQDAGDMLRLSRFNDLADRYGIIAVYPNAIR